MVTSSKRDSDIHNSIKVAVRLRPFSKNELRRGDLRVVDVVDDQIVLDPPTSNGSLELTPRSKPSKKFFRYDQCYWSFDGKETGSGTTGAPFATQDLVFEQLGKPLIDHAFDGFNNCIFAYGQTGSGKSYTMMGTAEEEGLIPRISKELFSRIQQFEGQVSKRFSVEVSYLEIYNEKVRDLLDPKSKNLKVREHPAYGPYVEDLSKLAVSSYSEVRSLIAEGNKTRTVAATNMNQTSSRSHAVFTITLTQITDDKETGLSSEKSSRISLIDLAGSERASVSGTTGIRLKEGAEINRSLATLGRVISTLSELATNPNRKQVVPYRDSTLTWLLKDSLGGNSMTTMVAALSPSPYTYEQTLSTLRFADSAKKIQNRAVVNEDPNAKLIRELKEELAKLKDSLSKEENYDAQDLRDQLLASEKLLAEANQTWEQRMLRTQEIQKQREKRLEELGISLDGEIIGLSTPKKTPHLVNLSEDPLLAECLVYNIKGGETIVANADDDVVGIKLQGDRIMTPHCNFNNDGRNVTIVPKDNASVIINGSRITEPTVLQSGFRIILGGTHVFRFNHPRQAMEHRRRRSSIYGASPLSREVHSGSPNMFSNSSATTEVAADWEDALYEVAEHFQQNNLENMGDEEFERLFGEMERLKYMRAATSAARDSESAPSTPRPTTPPSFITSPLSNGDLNSPRSKRASLLISAIGNETKGLSIDLFNNSNDSRLDGERYLKEREGLIKTVISKWKSSKLIKQIQAVIGYSELIYEAHAAASELGTEVDFQLLILDIDRYRPSGCDWDVESRESYESPKLCVRVLDWRSVGVWIWTLEKFEQRLSQARTLLTMRNNQSQKHHVSDASNPFLDIPEDPSSALTYIGYATVDKKVLEHNGRLSLDIYSPFTNSVVGGTILSLYQGMVKLTTTGLIPEEIRNVVVVVNKDNCTVPLDEELAAEFRLPDCDILKLTFHSQLGSQFLVKLKSWDEMQEPGLDMSRASSLQSWDVRLNAQCLELDEEGTYVPTNVVCANGRETIMLHHGLQRRLRFFIVSPEKFFKKEADINLVNVRLVDVQGIMHKDHCFKVKLVPVKPPTISDTLVGFTETQFECQWDSSAHNSGFLNRHTKNGYSVLVGCEIHLSTFQNEPVVLSFDFNVAIKPRTYSVSLWDTIFKSVTIAEQLQTYFRLDRRALVPESYDDFALMSPSASQSFRARGVSVLREYYRANEQINHQLAVQSASKFPKPDQLSKDRRSPADYQKLYDAINLWKRPSTSTDQRLARWDYRELTVSRPTGISQRKFHATEIPVSGPVDLQCIVQFARLLGEVDISIEGLQWLKWTLTLRGNMLYICDNNIEKAFVNLHNWNVESIQGAALTKHHVIKLTYENFYLRDDTTTEVKLLINFIDVDEHEKFLLLCNRQLNEYHDRRYL